MRKIRDKGIAKLYAAAMRSRKAKHTKKVGKKKAKRHSRPQAKRRTITARGRAKVEHVMREFYHGDLTSHGHQVARPDVAKAIAMSEGRAISRSKPRKRKSAKRAAPKRRVVKRTAKRRSSPQARSRPQVDHRVIRHAARKAPRKRTEAERTALAHASSRSWASGRMAKRIKKVRRKSTKKASPAQLAARKKFVEMVRARAADKKGPNRRTRGKIKTAKQRVALLRSGRSHHDIAADYEKAMARGNNAAMKRYAAELRRVNPGFARGYL